MIQITIPQFSIIQADVQDYRKYRHDIQGGIYFLYNSKKELLYIGLSKDVSARIGQHIGGAKNNPFLEFRQNFVFFSAFPVACPVERDIYETYLINQYQPPYNSNKTFTYESNLPLTSMQIMLQEKTARHAEEMALTFSL